MADTIPGQISNLAVAQIQEVFQIAETLKNDALSRMEALASSAQTLLTALDGVTYEAGADGVNTTFSAPTIDTSEPDLSGEAPIVPTLSDAATIPTSLDYTDTDYTPEVKTNTKVVITDTLAGNGLLSDADYQAMYDEAEADLGREQVAAEWDAADNGARLGWKLPAEASIARLDEVADQTSRNMAKTRLGHTNTKATQRREDIAKTVDAATAFEGMWIGEHNTHEQRKLDAAKSAVEVAIAISGAMIAQDDLQLKAFGVQWQGILTRIQAQSELWKARLAPAQLAIDSERVRAQFAGLESENLFKQADGETSLALQRVQILVPQTLGVLTEIAKMISGLGQAALSASDVSLGTSAPWSYTESHSYCEKSCP